MNLLKEALLSVKKGTLKFLRQRLEKAGYRLVKITPPSLIDIRKESNHPFELLYRSQFDPILIDADIRWGRSLRNIALDPPEEHPFAYAIIHGMKHGDRELAIRDALQSYYASVQPQNPAEWMGIGHSSILCEYPAWALSMPWDKRTPYEWQLIREDFVLNENKEFQKNLTIEQGWHFWGPAADEKIEIETKRLDRLVSSLLKNGLARHDGHDGDIRAVVLKNDAGDWRWQVTGGEHRAAGLAAFGYKSIPIRVIQIVNRQDVNIWPNVTAGFFTREEALAVFDQIFSGIPTGAIRNWKK